MGIGSGIHLPDLGAARSLLEHGRLREPMAQGASAGSGDPRRPRHSAQSVGGVRCRVCSYHRRDSRRGSVTLVPVPGRSIARGLVGDISRRNCDDDPLCCSLGAASDFDCTVGGGVHRPHAVGVSSSRVHLAWQADVAVIGEQGGQPERRIGRILTSEILARRRITAVVVWLETYAQ